MTPEQTSEVLSKLNLVIEDFIMLRDGEWSPDRESCEASIDNIDSIIYTIKNNLIHDN